MPAPISLVDIKLAVRAIRKQPLLSLTSALALATGIGLATTGFTVLDAVLFSRLPFAGGDRFVVIEAYAEPNGGSVLFDGSQFRILADHVTELEHVGATRSGVFNLLQPSGDAVPIRGALLTPDSFRVLPYAPVLGRSLVEDDAVSGAPAVATIRESLWRRVFAGDPAVVGSTVDISGTTRTIVGIMPDDCRFPSSAEIWIPFDRASFGKAPDSAGARLFGVLRQGHRIEAADAEVSALSASLTSSSPGAPRLRVHVVSFTEAVSRGLDLLTGALTMALVMVLLVIAGNISSLTLARTVSRSSELAIRSALGASRARLVGQILVETIVVAVPAAVVGLVASQTFLRWMTSVASDMPSWLDFTASPRTMAFVAIVTTLVSAVAGVWPGIRATRGNTAAVISEGRHQPGLGRVGTALIAAQVALAIAFLNGALVMARGVAGYGKPLLTLPANQVLTARVTIAPPRPGQFDAIVEAVGRMPGVVSAGLATSLPHLSPATEMVAIEPAPGETASAPRAAPIVGVTAGLLETLGGRPMTGQLFELADFKSRARVAVVNEPFVRKFFSGANPVGRRLRLLSADPASASVEWREIIGVVPDLGLSAGDAELSAGVYVPLADEESVYIALRTEGDARRLAPVLPSVIARVNPTIQTVDVVRLEDVGIEDRTVFAGIGGAMTVIGVMALGLSAISLYALLALSVTRRTRETGIRLALGASRAHILRSLTGRGAIALAVGALAGMALATVMVDLRWIFAFRLPNGSGPWGPPGIAAALVVCGVLAGWGPMRRAIRIDPAEALRQN
jgi:putative ABC transport system permease protein